MILKQIADKTEKKTKFAAVSFSLMGIASNFDIRSSIFYRLHLRRSS